MTLLRKSVAGAREGIPTLDDISLGYAIGVFHHQRQRLHRCEYNMLSPLPYPRYSSILLRTENGYDVFILASKNSLDQVCLCWEIVVDQIVVVYGFEQRLLLHTRQH